MLRLATALILLTLTLAQQPGHQKVDGYPPLEISRCTKSGGCVTAKQSIVIDSNWDWLHPMGHYTNCYTGNSWNTSICSDPKTCASNCALDADTVEGYETTYGISTSGTALKLKFVTTAPPPPPAEIAPLGVGCCSWSQPACSQCGNTTDYCKASEANCVVCSGTWCPNGEGPAPPPGPTPPAAAVGNVGSRNYLLAADGVSYEMFKLKNKEFTFDVDVSQLVCGLNGALYFVAMDADGGMAKYPSNQAGAKYGTGYCDAQCPHDIKFINGEANLIGWNGTDASTGKGKYGTCCTEMDIWEANKNAQAYTPHTCTTNGQTRCEGEECDGGEQGLCDASGCDINPYRMGIKDFFGEGSGFTVDSSKPMTVVTQFLTSDNTDTGDLTEIRRLYVQNGKVINSPSFDIGGETHDSITDKFCTTEATAFADKSARTEQNGGLKKMGKDMENGMVLVMSLWDDAVTKMQWLDSSFPPASSGQPGYVRGPCSLDSGDPADLIKNNRDATVTYSNIKIGEIGSTYSGGPGPSPPTPPTPPAPPTPSPSGCPGGSLSACIGLCPSDPPVVYKACVQNCAQRCA